MFVKYFENGVSVIPLIPNEKRPAITEWSKYCVALPDAEKVEVYESSNFGIGAALGSVGLVAIDIDCDPNFNKNHTKEMAEFIYKACPQSPVRKKGNKGETRFFRYNEKTVNRKIKLKIDGHTLVEILSTGCQTVLPPTIHPDTKRQYVWLTPDTLENFNIKDLPEITNFNFLNEIERLFCQGQKIETVSGGRNDKLKNIVVAMRGRGEPEEKIYNEVYDVDFREHNPRLFTDKSENFEANDEDQALKNAMLFVLRVSLSLVRSGVVPAISVSNDDDFEETEIEKIINYKSYPEPSGFLKSVSDLILSMSNRKMPGLAIGGALSCGSILSANRFRAGDVWPNVYVLNLAPTGAGKSWPQTVLKKLLVNIEDDKKPIWGYGNYKSDSAFLKNLVSIRSRLDVVDEFASVFSLMKAGGAHQSGLLQVMCSVWSSSGELFKSAEYATKEGESCYNPCISILGSSTVDGVKSSISKSMISDGLIPRFFLFVDDFYGEAKKSKIDEQLMTSVQDEIQKILKIQKQESLLIKDVKMGPCYDPINLEPIWGPVSELLSEIEFSFSERIPKEQNETMKQMLSRGFQQIKKAALIHAFGREISIKDVVWAKDLFDVSLHNAMGFLGEASADNEWEKTQAKIKNLFLRQKNGFLTEGRIINRLTIQPKIAAEQLSALEKSGFIKKEPSKKRGGPSGFVLKK